MTLHPGVPRYLQAATPRMRVAGKYDIQCPAYSQTMFMSSSRSLNDLDRRLQRWLGKSAQWG